MYWVIRNFCWAVCTEKPIWKILKQYWYLFNLDLLFVSNLKNIFSINNLIHGSLFEHIQVLTLNTNEDTVFELPLIRKLSSWEIDRNFLCNICKFQDSCSSVPVKHKYHELWVDMFLVNGSGSGLLHKNVNNTVMCFWYLAT